MYVDETYSVRTVLEVYTIDATFDVILRDCFELKMFFSQINDAGGAGQARITGPYISSSGTNNRLVLQESVLGVPGLPNVQMFHMCAPSPSILINDVYTVDLKGMGDGDSSQFVVQKQIIISGQ